MRFQISGLNMEQPGSVISQPASVTCLCLVIEGAGTAAVKCDLAAPGTAPESCGPAPVLMSRAVI